MNETIKKMVIEQFGDAEYFAECAQDIVNHGADGGFNGFIYHSDTVPFGERLRPYIKPILIDMADEFGLDSLYSLMATFKCLEGFSMGEIVDGWHSNDDEDAHTAVMNCLSWFALEEVASDLVENEEVAE